MPEAFRNGVSQTGICQKHFHATSSDFSYVYYLIKENHETESTKFTQCFWKYKL